MPETANAYDLITFKSSGMRPQSPGGGGGGSPVPTTRGWTVLREQWGDYLKDGGAGKRLGKARHSAPLDLGEHPPLRHRSGLSKEAADRAIDQIIGHFNEDSPRGAAQMKSWIKARQSHQDVRNSLTDIGWKVSDGPSPPPPQPVAVDVQASALFPKSWFRVLDDDLMADLIVDAFEATFVDAFVDGAINLADMSLAETLQAGDETLRPGTNRSVASGSRSLTRSGTLGTRLGESVSSPGLLDAQPRLFRPLVAPFKDMPPYDTGGVRASDLGRSASTSATWRNNFGQTGTANSAFGQMGGASSSTAGGPKEGFTMKGLPRDSHEAWMAHQYHPSEATDGFRTRIKDTTEAQRPHRRLVRPKPRSDDDQRKYSWPMTKTHLPEIWEDTTQKRKARMPRAAMGAGRRGGGADAGAEDDEDEDKGNGLLGVDTRSGKTTFPYSLVLHKAFLDSQPDEVLKAKAHIAAPLRLSTALDADYWD